MIQIVPQMKIFLSVEPVDFRKGIDGLAGVCTTLLNKDPFSGAIFLFINRSRKAIKILVYDGQGFWLCQKRLSRGRIKHWPIQGESTVSSLTACELQVLLYNGDPEKIKTSPEWRKLVSCP